MRVSVLLIIALSVAACAQVPVDVEDTRLPVTIEGHAYALEAIIVKPQGATGRLPVALLAHGSPRNSDMRPQLHARFLLKQAQELAMRGWMAVVFMRRGFGDSQGPYAEGFTCAGAEYARALGTAVQDIEAVHRAVASRADADPSRIIGFGISVGGASMIAWSATRPEGLRAVINISGGTGSLRPNQNCNEDALVAAFATYGARSRVPTLWLYSANDGYFGPRVVGRMQAAFTKGGGHAELVSVRPIGNDGHDLCCVPEGRELWLPAMDRFLREQGLAPTVHRP